MRNLSVFLAIACALWAEPSVAAGRILTLHIGGETRQFGAAELLARPDAATVSIPRDLSYQRSSSFRAVPLLALIGIDALDGVDTLEARASDGFVAQIPADLVRKAATGGSVAWVAVEDAADPWPPLPNKQETAGPFYLVWEHPARSNVSSEHWPYQLVALTAVENPLHRWPQLAVDAALPADAPERLGQRAYIRTCMSCHRLNGAGAGVKGPDLGQPMNATAYMTPAGLRALIRDPKSVRTWPEQQMEGFDTTQISDAELDGLIAFLTHMARR